MAIVVRSIPRVSRNVASGMHDDGITETQRGAIKRDVSSSNDAARAAVAVLSSHEAGAP
jgi:hypothetical protein